MAATTIKTDPIQSDKVKFRTQIVDGKPQIFFDAINDSSTKARPKRNSRSMNNPQTNRLAEQQKSKINNQKSPSQNGTTRTQQPTNKVPKNEDGSSLGVYMTMDELSELVKAVKENAKTDNNTTAEHKHPPPPPPLPHQLNESTTTPVVPKLDLSSEHLPPPRAQISPREQALSVMADKKRQKWLREKAEIEQMQLQIEYDKLKQQLSPRHKNTSVSPERSTFQYDFPPANKPQPPPPAPAPPQSYHQYDASPKVNEDPNNDLFKTRLMEKKQQQWKQENSEKMPVWNPFGRPGAGAPQLNENQTRTSQLPPNDVIPYRPPPQQQLDNSSSSLPPSFLHSDQTRVPAAMRTNLLFGDVRFDEDVKTAKEIERRQWLDDLQKQIEDNKRQKFTQHETERRQDFLHENVQPLVQAAANRHQQQQKETSSNITRPNNTEQDTNKFNQRDSVVQQTYDKIREAGELAKYEKTSQLIEKLKRNGHQTDLLAKTLPDVKSTVPPSNQRTGEKLFGPNYETSSNQNMNSKIDPLHLNAPADRKQPYRPFDARRDDAVNTVGSTFRSEHSVQTDVRIPPHKQTNPYAYEDSDLPPHAPNHHNRNSNNQQGKKSTTRMRPGDDNRPPRRTSTTTYHSNIIDDGTASQLSGHRSNNIGPVDHLNRPLWNYRNSEQREYVPNSKRDPHYEKRQRLKHFEQGNYDRIDDVQKKTCYNRWNSDSELQQQRQKKQNPINRVHSTVSKTTSHGNRKDESIMNLLRGQNKQQEAFGTIKTSSNQMKTDDEYHSNHTSALENYVPYTRADEAPEPAQAYSPRSQSRETSPQRQGTETYDNYPPREWNNTNRQNPSVQPGSYDAPPSRQEHILQQLSAIKENLVRRQRELATSMNAIPV